MLEFFKAFKSPEQRLAWAVALAADALQIVALPLFATGVLSPADIVLDVLTAGILIRLLGWHWALVPALLAELVPAIDVFPTWTASVYFVTRDAVRSSEPEILPPGPAPPRRPQ